MKEDKLFSVWSSANEILTSQYGNVTYRQWCEHEIVRMNGRLKIVNNPRTGEICLAWIEDA